MRYVVLLRGVNVGGNSKVSMKELKLSLEEGGFTDVRTYINSGNILLTSELSTDEVNSAVEVVIKQTFGFDVVAVTLISTDFQRIANSIPHTWTNDSDMKCDILFLWRDVDSPQVLDTLIVKPDVDTVKYVPGAVLWSVDRKNVARSGLIKIIGTPTYKQATARNCNTVRKLASLLDAV